MADLTPTRTFYEAQSRDALGLAFVAQLRAVAAAQRAVEGIDFADLTEPGNLYEQLHFAVQDEVERLRPLAEQMGLPLHYLRGALA